MILEAAAMFITSADRFLFLQQQSILPPLISRYFSFSPHGRVGSPSFLPWNGVEHKLGSFVNLNVGEKEAEESFMSCFLVATACCVMK